MKNILKILLWLVVIAIVAYLAFGRSKKEVVAPSPEATGGPAGERAEIGENLDTGLEINSQLGQ